MKNTKNDKNVDMKTNGRTGELSSLNHGESSFQNAYFRTKASTDPHAKNLIKILENSKIKIHVNATDVPLAVQESIHNFNLGEYTSEEEQGASGPNSLGNWFLHTSPNSTFELQVNKLPQNMDTEEPPSI